MNIEKVTDGELHVLNALWAHEEMTASELVKQLAAAKNWNRNTTYTFVNRLVEKGIIRRTDPGFVCRALFTREQVTLSESKSFLAKMFNGSLNLMVANFIDSENLSQSELDAISGLINKRREAKHD